MVYFAVKGMRVRVGGLAFARAWARLMAIFRVTAPMTMPAIRQINSLVRVRVGVIMVVSCMVITPVVVLKYNQKHINVNACGCFFWTTAALENIYR